MNALEQSSQDAICVWIYLISELAIYQLRIAHEQNDAWEMHDAGDAENA